MANNKRTAIGLTILALAIAPRPAISAQPPNSREKYRQYVITQDRLPLVQQSQPRARRHHV